MWKARWALWSNGNKISQLNFLKYCCLTKFSNWNQIENVRLGLRFQHDEPIRESEKRLVDIIADWDFEPELGQKVIKNGTPKEREFDRLFDKCFSEKDDSGDQNFHSFAI